jgi:hypothetical protein
MKHTLTKLFTASLAVVVVMGQSVLGAMQDQDEIIARAISKEKEIKKLIKGEVMDLHLEKINEKGSGLISDVGLRKVAAHPELKQLKQLFLKDTKITNKGLFHLVQLKQLEFLSLAGCKKISNEGLKALYGCKNLKVLRLKGAAVSAEGIAKLRKALPNCRISEFNAKR